MIYENSIDALRQLLILADEKYYDDIPLPCHITKRPKRISYTKDGIEYCFVEVTCEDGVQYGIQAFGDEAIALYIEANRCTMCGEPSSEEKKVKSIEETIDGVHYTFDSIGCALTFKKLRSVYGRGFYINN